MLPPLSQSAGHQSVPGLKPRETTPTCRNIVLRRDFFQLIDAAFVERGEILNHR
jgi:hypothetical protein